MAAPNIRNTLFARMLERQAAQQQAANQALAAVGQGSMMAGQLDAQIRGEQQKRAAGMAQAAGALGQDRPYFFDQVFDETAQGAYGPAAAKFQQQGLENERQATQDAQKQQNWERDFDATGDYRAAQLDRQTQQLEMQQRNADENRKMGWYNAITARQQMQAKAAAAAAKAAGGGGKIGVKMMGDVAENLDSVLKIQDMRKIKDPKRFLGFMGKVRSVLGAGADWMGAAALADKIMPAEDRADAAAFFGGMAAITSPEAKRLFGAHRIGKELQEAKAALLNPEMTDTQYQQALDRIEKARTVETIVRLKIANNGVPPATADELLRFIDSAEVEAMKSLATSRARAGVPMGAPAPVMAAPPVAAPEDDDFESLWAESGGE